MDGMILGRNTQQWMGVITATVGFVGVIIGVAFPMVVGPATIILNGLTGVLGVWVAFLANTATTPIKSPQLQVGTVVSATDPNTGVVVGHVKVPEPTPAPLAEDVGPQEDDVDGDGVA